ncbi:hypothetical protein GCM10010313_30340 [Streptomyces violarus]|nr:hypothetical protein GCM10010313_30340 [Streptomyces violarus]
MFVGSGSVNLKSAPDPTMARCLVSPFGTDILPGAPQAALCFVRRTVRRTRTLSGAQGTLRNRCDHAA